MYTRTPKITYLNCQKELKGSGSYQHFKACNEKYGAEGNPNANKPKPKSHHAKPGRPIGSGKKPIVQQMVSRANGQSQVSDETDWLKFLTDKNLIYKINDRLTILHNDKTTIENEIGLLQRVKSIVAATVSSPEPSPGSMESTPVPDVTVLRTHDVLDK